MQNVTAGTEEPTAAQDRTVSNPAARERAGDAPTIEPGDVLADRFEIERRLGSGGTGEVFAAVDRESGARLALKALRVPRPGRAHLIKAEFRAVQGIIHPHLVAFHELYVEPERAFLTMDLVEGVPLSQAGSQNWQRLFHQCVVGLGALHARGLVHRDVKPANVLVDENEHVTLIDFGLAGRRDRSARAAGTPAYMAPEQARGQVPTPASDWYAVGVMLYECLTGKLPFDGNDDEVQAAKGWGPPPAPSSLDPRVPEDLDGLCMRLLQARPEDRPDGHEILRVLAGGRVHEGPRPHFVGRARELETLRGVYRALEDGTPSLMIVHGPAGTGKSTVVRRLLDELAGNGRAMVETGACNEYENVPFNAFDGIVDALAQRLAEAEDLHGLAADDLRAAARVFPVLRQLAGENAPAPAETLPREQRRDAFRVLTQVLAKLGDRAPLVLAIDDVQWADRDSLDLLQELLTAPAPPAVLLIACWRTGSGACPFVDTLREAPAAWARQELSLGPLSSAESVQLARALAGTADVDLQRLASESGGNPLLLEELSALGHGGTGVATLEAAIRSRLDHLAAPERQVVELVSAYGRPVPRALAHHLAASHGGRRVVKRLCNLRLARWTGHREDLDVYHPRIREEVYAALAPEPRRAHHLRLVDALRSLGDASAALLAEHLQRGGKTRRALEQMRLAAREAAAGLAFHQAARWLRLALSLPEAKASEGELRIELADILAVAGIGQEASREYEKAAALAGDGGALELRRKSAEQLLVSGHMDEGFSRLDEVHRRLRIRKPRTAAGALVSLLGGRVRLRIDRRRGESPVTAETLQRIDALAAGASGYMLHDTLRGAWFASRQLLYAQRAGDPTRLLRALVNEALYLANEGTRNAAELDALIERARDLARRAGGADGLLYTAIGVGSLLVGRWQQALAALSEAERLLVLAGTGGWWELILCRKFRSIAMWFCGTLTELSEPLETWLDDARARGDAEGYRSFAGEQPILSLARGLADDAREQIGRLQRQLDGGRLDEHGVVNLHNRIQLSLYADDDPQTLLDLAQKLRPFWRSLLARGQLIRVTSQYYVGQCYVAAWAGGGRGDLRARALRAAAKLEGEGARYATLYAQMLRAAIAHLGGDDGEARRLLEDASAGFAADGQRLAWAGARWRLGELVGGPAGASIIDEGQQEMNALGIGDPRRFLRIVAPGFHG
ncbi:MAG TPA: AAA family ATPase [Kofleriaceae bacterium]|nr:AAA family ATPase [Kofleriaceae bacterium]